MRLGVGLSLVEPRRGGAAAAFSPADVPGLVLWLDAAEGTYQSTGGSAALADGDPVGEWQDQSGSGRHYAQSTSGSRPTLRDVTYGGRTFPVVRFDGTDDILTGNAAARGLFRDAPAAVVYCVVKFGKAASSERVWTWSIGGAITARCSLTGLNTNLIRGVARRQDADSATNADSLGVKNTSDFFLLKYQADYATGPFRVAVDAGDMTGSSSTSTGNTQDADSQICTLGAAGNVTETLQGDLAFLAAFRRVLAADEEALLYDYLTARYFGAPALTFGYLGSVEEPRSGTTAAKLPAALAGMAAAGCPFVVHGGDLLDFSSGGSEAAALSNLAAVKAVFDAGGIPTHYGVGNHDLDFLTKAQWLGALGQSDTYYSFDEGDYHFVVLDPCFRSDSDSDPYAAGNFNSNIAYVNPAQRSWLAADLAATSKKTVVFCEYSPASAELTNAAAVQSILEASGKVLGVFSVNDGVNGYAVVNGVRYFNMRALDLATPASYALCQLYAAGKLRVRGAGEQANY